MDTASEIGDCDGKRAQLALVFGMLFSIFFIPAHFLNHEITSFDDRSYLSHAFTLGLDGDLDYSNEIATKFNRGGDLPAHPIGSGLLAAPFIAAFGVLDRITNNHVILDRSKYFSSWSYFGFLFSVSFFFLVGVRLYFQTIKFVYKEYTLGLHVVTLFGTGVIYYVLGRFSMAHGFEFFALSATVFAATVMYQRDDGGSYIETIGVAVVVGFFVVLNLWIRPSNLNSLALPFIWLLTLGVVRTEQLSPRVFWMVALGILIWLVPYCAFNWAYYHQLFPSYATAYNLSLPSGLEVDSTHLLSIETVVHWIKSLFSLLPNTGLLLFSSEVGLVYSNPILPIGFIAFLWFLSRGGGLNNWRVGVMIAALVFSYYSFSVAIVLLWKTTASDYGYRYLFPLIPVALLFTAVMLKGIEGASLTKKTIVKSTIVVLSLIGTINVFFYKVTPLLSPMEQENVYGEWHGSSLRDYEVNLVKELTNYRTFVLAGGKSYLGFLAAPYFLDTGLVEIIPPSIREKFVPRFRDVPSVIYIQTGMLALLWVGFGWFWNQKSRRSDETNHSTSLL